MSAHQELAILAIGMVNFLLILLGLTVLLSIARRVRIHVSRRPVTVTSPVTRATGDDTAPSAVWTDPSPTKPSPAVLVQYRSAIRSASSNPVTLFIEPDAGPTRHQRTVQRLIAYLKEESAKTTASASPL